MRQVWLYTAMLCVWMQCVAFAAGEEREVVRYFCGYGFSVAVPEDWFVLSGETLAGMTAEDDDGIVRLLLGGHKSGRRLVLDVAVRPAAPEGAVDAALRELAFWGADTTLLREQDILREELGNPISGWGWSHTRIDGREALRGVGFFEVAGSAELLYREVYLVLYEEGVLRATVDDWGSDLARDRSVRDACLASMRLGEARTAVGGDGAKDASVWMNTLVAFDLDRSAFHKRFYEFFRTIPKKEQPDVFKMLALLYYDDVRRDGGSRRPFAAYSTDELVAACVDVLYACTELYGGCALSDLFLQRDAIEQAHPEHFVAFQDEYARFLAEMGDETTTPLASAFSRSLEEERIREHLERTRRMARDLRD